MPIKRYDYCMQEVSVTSKSELPAYLSILILVGAVATMMWFADHADKRAQFAALDMSQNNADCIPVIVDQCGCGKIFDKQKKQCKEEKSNKHLCTCVSKLTGEKGKCTKMAFCEGSAKGGKEKDGQQKEQPPPPMPPKPDSESPQTENANDENPRASEELDKSMQSDTSQFVSDPPSKTAADKIGDIASGDTTGNTNSGTQGEATERNQSNSDGFTRTSYFMNSQADGASAGTYDSFQGSSQTGFDQTGSNASPSGGFFGTIRNMWNSFLSIF